MKRSSIIGLIIISIAIASIIASVSDSSSYASFEEAFSNPGTEYHIVGELDPSAPVVYEPTEAPDRMSFHLEDENGERKKVVLHRSKPNDFERSEKIVLIGSAKKAENTFHAQEILLKCPSKYEDEARIDEMEAGKY